MSPERRRRKGDEGGRRKGEEGESEVVGRREERVVEEVTGEEGGSGDFPPNVLRTRPPRA
jgi:hypothetical protein